MKIIELYENIANGEEIPKKIKFEDKYYIFEERYGKYYRFGEPTESIEDDYYISKILNENVEVIEDKKIEDKRIEKIDLTEIIKNREAGVSNDTYLACFINLIIDKVNGEE